MYQCPSCGAGLYFSPKKQKLVCHYCNNEYNFGEIKQQKIENNESKAVEEKSDTYSALIYRCTQCGAELITTDETISTFCSYCGSSALLEKKETDKLKPSYIIPFKKTKEECEQAYRNKLKYSIFAPKNMFETQTIEKIRGIYMPYWIYTFRKNGEYLTRGKLYSRRVGDYIYYNDYELSTDLDTEIYGITHDASTKFADSLSESIAPYSIAEKKEFTPEYLSGFYADSVDVEPKIYEDDVNKVASKHVIDQLRNNRTYKKYNAKLYMNLNFENVEFGLFPAYFLATKNEKGDRISYAVINGQTGKIAAEIPIDYKKFFKVSLILAIPIFIVLNMFLTLAPISLAFIALILNIINIIISNKISKKLLAKEHKLEDKGVRKNLKKQPELNKTRHLTQEEIEKILGRKNNSYKQAKLQEKISGTIKNNPKLITGLIILLIILFIRPFQDWIYYMGATISIVMTIWSFIDIVNYYNLLTTNQLPQLEKRGGEEHGH